MQSAVLAIVNPSVRLSVCLSATRWHCVKTTQATITGSSPIGYSTIQYNNLYHAQWKFSKIAPKF